MGPTGRAGAAALLVAALAVEAAAEVKSSRVSVDERLCHLLSDFDANGVRESLLIRVEKRSPVSSDGSPGPCEVSTRLYLLEATGLRTGHGVLLEGRRYRYVAGGTFDLAGLEAKLAPGPRDNGHLGLPPRPSALDLGVQARFGMLSLVSIPLRRAGGEVALASLFNVERGVFQLAVDERSFAAIRDPRARAHFARLLDDSLHRGNGSPEVAEKRPGPPEP